MKNYLSGISRLCVLLAVVATTFTFASCKGNKSSDQKEMDDARKQLNELLAEKQLTGDYLVKFDTLDFVVFSNQEWVRFHESHDENIKVYWPDGHFTVGLEKHVEDMKAMFVYAPDTRIKEHPIKFGSGKYTAVTGVMEGTFTHPMPLGNGKFIQPTGKSFKIPMCTIGIWENGVMVEEHLFWDNQTYMQQLGVAK